MSNPLHTADPFLARLSRAKTRGILRALPLSPTLIDFCSNDYLGLASQGRLAELVKAWMNNVSVSAIGSTGSRLISGNSTLTESTEHEIARHHHAEAALLFNSGYDANIGLFSSLPRDDTEIIYDEHLHASAKDGISLCRARSRPFRHNDLEHLELRLKTTRKQPLVAVESVYSMDGSIAPLKALANLCAHYDGLLIVDEAHSVGVYGEKGAGLVCELGLEKSVFARVVTYGKAFGCQGAAVLGSETLKRYLINFSHSFIYTTGMTLLNVAAIRCAYQAVSEDGLQQCLQNQIQYFQAELTARQLTTFLPSKTAIQGCLIPGERAISVARTLADSGYDVKAIRSPTVKRGSERLRICVHAFNTKEQISTLLSILADQR